MTSRMFASVTALCAGALAIPYAAQTQDAAQVQMGQQAQAAPAPAAPAPAAPAPAAPAAGAPAAPAAPTSNAMATPAMGGTITANPNPFSVDLGPILGKTYITGQLTGMGLVQSQPIPSTRGDNPPSLSNGFSGNSSGTADISNGMVEIQKTDGMFQYYVDAGIYSLPVVGVPYINAEHLNSALFGPVPIAYAKWAPTDSLSFEVGKLPTLIGEEGTFTFQNLNIERGLLWNVENVVNRGIQGNYTWGPLAFALSWNDGYYTDNFKYLTGSVTWTIDSSDTVILAGGGPVSKYTSIDPATFDQFQANPIPTANQSQVDLSYTWTGGPWTINPYIQYTHSTPVTVISPFAAGGGVPRVFASGETYGASLLVGYTFDPSTTVMGMSLGGWSLPARIEWIGSSGSSGAAIAGVPVGAPANLLGYGANSKAWTFTVTPTYQYKMFFARAEASLVKISNLAQGAASLGTFGSGFGYTGNSTIQVRGLLEAGLAF
jgi:hypothetical protein